MTTFIIQHHLACLPGDVIRLESIALPDGVEPGQACALALSLHLEEVNLSVLASHGRRKGACRHERTFTRSGGDIHAWTSETALQVFGLVAANKSQGLV